MIKLTYVYLSLRHTCERSRIMKTQILKILRKQYLTLIGIRLLKISPENEEVDFLNKTLLTIFRNYIPNKKLNATIGNLNG